MPDKNEYSFSDKDLYAVINFVKGYHLDPTKGSRGRTNQGKRGFGGELDEWAPGKLIEIATCRILERYSNGKKVEPDFKIYSDSEVGERSDPDITEVFEDNANSSREPKLFIEIKGIGENDKWLGPRKHQLKGIERTQDSSNFEGYMIHTKLEFDDGKEEIKRVDKERDITASILKELVDSPGISFENFSRFSSLKAKIEYVYSFKDIFDKGHLFEKGSIIPETDFYESQNIINKDGSLRKGYEVLEQYEQGRYNLKMKIADTNEEPAYSEWSVEGKFWIVRKNTKEHIHCLTGTKMFNNLFGTFELLANKTYRFHFTNKLGKGNTKNIDDIWFSRRRLDEMIAGSELPSIDKSLEYIIESI